MTDYVSTRGEAGARSFEDVLLAGLAEDGGLFVPGRWPEWRLDDFKELEGLDYPETAVRILLPYVAGCFDEHELRAMCRKAYDRFDHAAVAPLKQLDHDLWLLELFHGPTLAFKDFALQLLGLMFDSVLKRRDRRLTIVGATSGDTGAAAIHACAGLSKVDIAILHPKGRVSDVQRRQMTTIIAHNVLNIAIDGTFDDCQNLVKAMFNDRVYRTSMQLGAINSINWARIIAQTVYYIHAAIRLGGLEHPLSFVVPTGNFGDVFAGYVAKRMGLPVDKFVVATNENDILNRFWQTGSYQIQAVRPTMSPSMDIQVASNFERYLFELEDRSAERVRALMALLQQNRQFTLSSDRHAKAKSEFAAGAASEAQTKHCMQMARKRTGELLDPHTAVGLTVADRMASSGEVKSPMIILGTAAPAKFVDAVAGATGVHPALPARMGDLMTLREEMRTAPNDLAAVQTLIRSAFRS